MFNLPALIPLLLVVAGARYLAAGALGMRGIRFFFGGAIESPEAVSPWRRALVVLAGMAASYLVAVSLFVAGFLVGGRVVRTTDVTVLEGKPAAQAGMATGDRVLTVGGEPVAEWEDLATAVASHAGQPLEIVVVRGEQNVRLTVTPVGAPDRGKIGITSAVMLRVPVGLGGALWRGVAAPVTILGEMVAGVTAILRGSAEGELAGPVDIVKAGVRATRSGPGDALYFIGALTAYCWPMAAIAAIVTVPRRRRVPRAPPPPR